MRVLLVTHNATWFPRRRQLRGPYTADEVNPEPVLSSVQGDKHPYWMSNGPSTSRLMIFVERPPAPPGFAEEAAKAILQAEQFFALARERRRGRSFDFGRSHSSLLKLSRQPLSRMFLGKCAYCETPATATGDSGVDFYRPRNGVAEASGGYLGDHYWRQAFSWTNLLLVCAVCNRNKANRFPVDGPRASADADDVEVTHERALLLNPCVDDPAEQLLFSSDGRVAGSTERGRVTIEILNLNRLQLVEARRLESAAFLAASDALAREQMLEAGRPFLALKRQLAAALNEPSRKERLERATSEQQDFDSRREAVDTTTKSGLENYRSRARYVERVHIENIASIEKLTLDLTAPASGTTPCFALLGNNGVGKSTVLKCIAIALSGRQYVRRLRLTSNSLLRDGERSGEIVVHVTGYSDPIVVQARRNRPLLFSTMDARALVVGYGATRLLANRRHRPEPGMAHAKIDNLFDPFLPLSDASRWLDSLSPERLDDAAATLRALLPDEDAARLTLTNDPTAPLALQVASDSPRRLSQLSDGYQSLLGLAVDLMDVMHEQGYQSMRSAQGIALVDELGNHFHPRWRMRIVGALRNAFPQVQFIFSTHDPLCLRGLGKGEVAVLRRTSERRVFVLEDLPDVEGLRVDQLLTSEHFGLDTTVDPKTEDEMREYRALSAKPDRTAIEDIRLEELVGRLTELRLLGSTRRERQLLRLLDLDEAQHPMPDGITARASDLTEATIARLQNVLRALEPTDGSRNPQ